MRRLLGVPRYKITGANLKIIWDGNSIGYGTGSSNPATKAPSARLGLYAPLQGLSVPVSNIAVAGQSLITLGTAPSTMVGRISGNLAPALAAGRLNVVVCHEMVNELVMNSNNVTTTINGWKTYATNVRAAAAAAGKQVQLMLLTTEAGRAGTQTDAQIIARNAARKQCNEIIRRDFRTMGFDYVVDVARMYPFSRIEDADDYSASAFAAWNAQLSLWTKSDASAIDYLHYGDVGSDYKAQLVAPAFRRLRKPHA